MDYIDYYKTLEINKSASQDEIKKAYRKLARKYHPDLNPNDKDSELKFKEINEANEVLSNPENRAKYDKYGKDWQQAEAFEKAKAQQENTRQNTYTYSGNDFSGNDYSDFFESMFGQSGGFGRRSKTTVFKGEDYHAEMQLNLSETFKTHKKTFHFNGKDIRITVPAGIPDGKEIKLKGYGGKGLNGGPNGDLFIKFQIVNNSPFNKIGNDLYKTVDLDLYTALLGGDLTIDTFDGKVVTKIKPETENRSKLRLKGKGFPVYKKEGEFGNLIITFQIQIPKNLTAEEKELYTQLSKLRKS